MRFGQRVARTQRKREGERIRQPIIARYFWQLFCSQQIHADIYKTIVIAFMHIKSRVHNEINVNLNDMRQKKQQQQQIRLNGRM